MESIPLKFFDQSRFGGPAASPEERGDCDKTCLATLIGVRPESIPDYQELNGSDQWWKKRAEFLDSAGFAIFSFSEPDFVGEGVCIAVGKSPRGEWNHAVVARIEKADGGYKVRFLHDPHPTRKFIEGAPTEYDFVFKKLRYE